MKFQFNADFSYKSAPKPVRRLDPNRLEKVKVEGISTCDFYPRKVMLNFYKVAARHFITTRIASCTHWDLCEEASFEKLWG